MFKETNFSQVKIEAPAWSHNRILGIFYAITDIHTVHVQTYLEYNIIFLTIEKTERKPCCIREQIISIAMVSIRDFDNVTYDWTCVTSMNCNDFLET